jgi:hypothetical protein
VTENQDIPTMPTPDPALSKLDRLVGTWRLSGHLVGSDEETITGEMTYRWLPGGFFFEQSGHIQFGPMRIESTELISYDPQTGTFPSLVFSNMAPTPLNYRWSIDGDDLTISVNEGPLDATYHGRFSDDANTFAGGWRPNPGADPMVNVAYDVAGSRVS